MLLASEPVDLASPRRGLVAIRTQLLTYFKFACLARISIDSAIEISNSTLRPRRPRRELVLVNQSLSEAVYQPLQYVLQLGTLCSESLDVFQGSACSVAVLLKQDNRDATIASAEV